MESRPKVSIIMNCFNGEQYLKEAIDSIYQQTWQNWEIIFFDNASSDASGRIAQSYDKKLRYFLHDHTVPLGAARNLALSHADGDYIAFLDCDDKWLPAKLEKQVVIMENNPAVGLVHCDAIKYNQDTGASTLHFLSLQHKPPRGKIFSYLLRVNAFSMPTVLLRASALHAQNEWFDERFEIYTDFDLFRRIAHDWECDFVDEPLAFYRVHSGSSSIRNHRKSAEELEITLKKFLSLYPDMNQSCAREVSLLQSMVAYQKGKSYWRDGKKREARAEFRKHIAIPKMFLSYFAAMAPFSLTERLWGFLQWLRQASIRHFREKSKAVKQDSHVR